MSVSRATQMNFRFSFPEFLFANQFIHTQKAKPPQCFPCLFPEINNYRQAIIFVCSARLKLFISLRVNCHCSPVPFLFLNVITTIGHVRTHSHNGYLKQVLLWDHFKVWCICWNAKISCKNYSLSAPAGASRGKLRRLIKTVPCSKTETN